MPSPDRPPTVFVSHPLLKKDAIERREYQEILAARVLERGNSLVVAPTALGKTVVAVLVAAQKLSEQPAKKVLLLAPTKPLAEQHARSFQKLMDIPEDQIQVFTGTLPPEKRIPLWNQACVISATAQTIENDVLNGHVHLRDVSLLVVDEAHRAVKDYAYVFLAQKYRVQNPAAHLLALTASPGGEEERIRDVCKNLNIANVEIKTLKDEDVAPYVNHVEFEWEVVHLPEEFLEIKKHLLAFTREQVVFLKRLGLARNIAPHMASQKALLELQAQVRKDIQRRASQNPLLYQAASKAAALLKVMHATTLLETQGIYALDAYLEKMRAESEKSGASKAVKSIARDPHIHKALRLSRELKEKRVNHPKIEKLKEILADTLAQNKNARVLVFNHYRASAIQLLKEIEGMEGVRATRFVGQASREGDKGMSQKEQSQVVQAFRDGTFNVLLATSVAEEGIDIPEVDLVVFYEAVPSEIRTIQRRGRTGRLDEGRCIVLLAKGTRDEAFYWSSKNKEQQMHATLSSMRADAQGVSEKYALGKQATLVKYQENDPNAVFVYVDAREQKSPVAEHLSELGAQVKIKQIPVGDFVLSDAVVAERKSVPDFVQSVMDGRLFEQLLKMKHNYENPLVVVEGNPAELFTVRNVNKNAILAALASTALDYRVPVLFAQNPLETAQLLHVIAKREQIGKHRDIRLRTGAKKEVLHEQQQFLVEGLPKVGPTLAKSLLKHFGSPKALFAATEKDLVHVDKMGPKKAKEIRRIIEQAYNDNPPTE